MQEQESNDRKWYLAAKLLSGKLDESEITEWENFRTDSKFTMEFETVKKYWTEIDALPQLQIDKEKDWQIILEQVKDKQGYKRSSFSNNWLRYAAVISMLLVVSIFTVPKVLDNFSTGDKANSHVTNIESPSGSRTLVTLPDSSKVWLNAHSKISYDNNFGDGNRYLILQGEAFFEVVKSKTAFIVHTSLYDVSVLGTAFNVTSYPEDESVATTLLHGSVKIEYTNSRGEEEEILLKPNERIVVLKPSSLDTSSYSNEIVYEIKKGIDASMDTGWKDGWLSVNGESLKDLAKKMERIYDIKIEFRDKTLEAYRYTGRIKQLSLEQVLKALSLTSPVEFVVSEKTVILSEDKAEKSKYKSN
jgi:ferric-dicitrate binding protein FerR (iron transport regulator)